MWVPDASHRSLGTEGDCLPHKGLLALLWDADLLLPLTTTPVQTPILWSFPHVCCFRDQVSLLCSPGYLVSPV